MKNIYIDTLQIHDYMNNIGYLVEGDIQGLEMPAIRLSTYQRPGEFGAYMSNQLYDSRLISITGMIFGNNLSDFNTKKRALENALRITKDTVTVPVSKLLKFQTMDDLQLQVPVYLQSLVMNNMNLLACHYNLQLFAPDFSLLSQVSKNVGLATLSGGGFILPVIFPILFSVKVGGTALVNNAGDAESYPVITLNGPLTSPTITNVAQNRYVSLNLTIASGQVVTIDMKNKTIIQGTTPILGNMVVGSNWFWLDPGSNTITLNTSNVNDTGNIQIAYNDAYVGA